MGSVSYSSATEENYCHSRRTTNESVCKAYEVRHTFPHEVELHTAGEGDKANQCASVTWDLVQLSQQGITHNLHKHRTIFHCSFLQPSAFRTLWEVFIKPSLF